MTADRAVPGLRVRVLVLAGWSLLVWATRIDNIVGDDALSDGGKAARIALALSFVVPALAVVGLWWRRLDGRSMSAVRVPVALAVWTVVVWVVRGTGIALGDHGAAFIVVHVVLAIVSVTIAAWVLVLVRLRSRVAPT